MITLLLYDNGIIIAGGWMRGTEILVELISYIKGIYA